MTPPSLWWCKDAGMSGSWTAFTVQYDDCSYMSLWCRACLDAGLAGKADLLRGDPANNWNTEWDLDYLNRLAAGHAQSVHPPDEPQHA
jgi:hypothetical protein